MARNLTRAAEATNRWRLRNPEYGSSPRVRYKQLCKEAKERDIGLGISQEQHEALLLLPCHWCGGELNSTGGGLDRLDNGMGYLLGNVVPCCWSCNRAKHDLTVKEFLGLVRKICRRHGDN